MDKCMIEVKDVELVIHGRKILNEINVQFERGKIYGLVGRNGSGKTMLMKCICGFVHPTQGTILVNGKIIGKDIDFPEKMGTIIENPSFISHMSGIKNLEMLAKYKKCVSSEHIKQVMKLVKLDPESKLHVNKYSLGMKQRLGIAQAIMEKPELLILDEPFNGLDEDGVRDVRNILLKMKTKGVTIILSSHNAEDIRILCDSVYRMQKGNLVKNICDFDEKVSGDMWENIKEDSILSDE